MRRMIAMLIAFSLLARFALVGQAGDNEALAIIDKAIAAHGIKGKDTAKGYRGKNKGTLHINNLDLEFTQEVTVQTPDKFKEVMEFNVMGQKIQSTTVYNGKEGWIRVNNMDIKVTTDILNEFKEVAHTMTLAQGLFLKDKGIKLAVLGDVQVKGKPAVGIRVSKEGLREISFFFDKATGLMAKVERRARDIMSGQEVTEERIIVEYQDVGGRKVAKKAEVARDGKTFIAVDVVEARFVDSIGDSEFARPE